MNWISKNLDALSGDLAELVGPRNKTFFVRLTPGAELHTNYGVLKHDDMIGKPWGSPLDSHDGNRFLLLQPRIEDLLLKTRRNTQILFPKDIGFILLKLNVSHGDHILEAGTGSGAMTTALAHAVGPQGKVTTYEIRPEMQELAQENLARLGLEDRVIFKAGDIRKGFEETRVDAVFLDLPDLAACIPHVRQTLKPGGCFGAILPTTNQVSALITRLEINSFDFIEVCELLLRYYKPVPQRLRPKDRMVAHTGYLVFARLILPAEA